MAGSGSDPLEATSAEDSRGKLNTSVPHPARVYDALLGGKDNFQADREIAEASLRISPAAAQGARANRAFLERAVTYLVKEAGIRQFLDVGTGLPSANNIHEVAQAIAPETRVLYVDNDPVVMLHAQTLLTSSNPGRTGYIEADLREPRKILDQAAGLLDFGQPIAVMLLFILHAIEDKDDPWQIVTTLMDAVPSGSYLVISHAPSDVNPEMMEIARVFNERAQEKLVPRSREECARFFDGLDLVEPGLVMLPEWRPRSELETVPRTGGWCGVAVKP